jgi:hypothetical protein
MANWLWSGDIPLMVSRNRLAPMKRPKQAQVDWVMDSGGFTELQQHGRWRINAHTYAAEIERISSEIGRMVWASPQDWMCEPAVVHGGTFKGVRFAGTGLSVVEHQARTVGNFLELRALGAPVIAVLQGNTLAEYQACADRYEAAGVMLAGESVVGLGSVCRREATAEIGEIVAAMLARGIRCHGFGCKTGALQRYGGLLESADSMAWSLGGRRRGTCTHNKSRCANCLHWARQWREDLLAHRLGDEVQMAAAI